MDQRTIGFIGLGLMGRAMVECLQDQGHQMVVLGHRDRTGVDAAVARGAIEASSAAELARQSDVVMLCMGTSDQVEMRMLGNDGVLAGARHGQVVIDFGTSLPASTLMLGAMLADCGAAYLDAPLGRTPSHAREGKLNIMCSGDAGAFEQVRHLLEELGENVFHLGPLGTGHTIKLINNFYAMTSAYAMAEGLAMAEAAGVDPQALYKVLAAGPNHSGMMDFINNYARDGQIDLAFSVANAAKDVGYYRTMAEDLGMRSRMSGATDALLKEAKTREFGDKMVPQLVDYLNDHLKDKA